MKTSETKPKSSKYNEILDLETIALQYWLMKPSDYHFDIWLTTDRPSVPFHIKIILKLSVARNFVRVKLIK